METYTEIAAEELARRQRAARYEGYLGKAAALRGSIANLEQQGVINQPVIESLTQIGKLAAALPDTLVTRSSSLRNSLMVAGGQQLRPLIETSVADALESLRYREADRIEKLDAARTELQRIETALTEFA
jgi:hypothetical protein